MDPRRSAGLIAVTFVVLAIAIFVGVDVSRTLGIVLAFVAVAIGVIARLGIQARGRRG